MHYRPLGTTGISVSEIGFGAWGIGGPTPDGANSYGTTDDNESKRTLRAALDRGITFYDTSNIYGYGHSEELIGEVFKNERSKVIIGGKVGFTKHRGPHDISPAFIRTCLAESLGRLQTDYLDVYMLHSPPLELVEKTPEAMKELQKLKAEGTIRAIGYSVQNPEDAIPAIEQYGFEVIEVNFNMIDQRILESDLFNVAKKRGVGIIARTPFAFGFLTGTITDLHFSPNDHRSLWPEQQLKRWAEAPQLFSPVRDSKGWTPTQLALKFCIGFDAVASVIPGMLHPNEVMEDAAASDLPPLNKEELEAIETIYKTNVFFDKSLKKT